MKFEIYRDRSKKREYRWRLKARNGRIIATSGEGYRRRSGAVKAAKRLIADAAQAYLEMQKGRK